MIPVPLVHCVSSRVFTWHLILNIWYSKTVLPWDNQQTQLIVWEAKKVNWGSVLLTYIYCVLTMHWAFIISWIGGLFQEVQRLQLYAAWLFSPCLKHSSMLKGNGTPWSGVWGPDSGLYNCMYLSFPLCKMRVITLPVA